MYFMEKICFISFIYIFKYILYIIRIVACRILVFRKITCRVSCRNTYYVSSPCFIGGGPKFCSVLLLNLIWYKLTNTTFYLSIQMSIFSDSPSMPAIGGSYLLKLPAGELTCNNAVVGGIRYKLRYICCTLVVVAINVVHRRL